MQKLIRVNAHIFISSSIASAFYYKDPNGNFVGPFPYYVLAEQGLKTCYANHAIRFLNLE